MSEMMIRRNGGPAALRTPVKTGKASGSAQAQQTRRTAGYAAPDGLRQAISVQAGNGAREARSTLQTGEAVLDELQNTLEQIESLVQDVANDKNSDKNAIQEKLETLKQEIDRIIGSAVSGDKNLFLDDSAEIIPGWLTQTARTPAQILSALGLGGTAGAGEILSAVLSGSLDSNSAAGYLAALYLGAVIADSEAPETVDPETAMEGLRRLLDKVAEGVPLDEAVTLLTNGAFTGIEDFENDFLGGTAPGMQDFLINLLLTDSMQTAEFPAMDFGLTEFMDMNLDMMMSLFSLLGGLGSDMPDMPGTETISGTDNRPIPAAEITDSAAPSVNGSGGTEIAVMQGRRGNQRDGSVRRIS